jgi:ABC-type metal ion transport system substrate-binding protein
MELYEVIRSLILQIVSIDYQSENIKQGFQAPTADNFISYIVTDSIKTGITGVKFYNETDDVMNNNLLYQNTVQIDYYSDKPYIAQNNANKMHNYLTAFAMDYLNNNYYGYSIGIIDRVRNMTDPADKGKYQFRYTIRFDLFSHDILTVPQIFTDQISANAVFIE